MKSTKTLAELKAQWALEKSATYILGAGFSADAGLPLADDLWKEVYRRALPMTGRGGQFRDDLDDYIKFKQRCEGRSFTRDDVDFEEFLEFLDVEHHLGLRGSDTWSEDGNESQVIIKTLIGQILTERMPRPNKIPDIYLRFAECLQPWDKVITFNYDILLERACEVVGKPYRLAPMRYTEVGEFTASIDDTCLDEISILKLHGSIDWFDRKSYRRREEDAHKWGHTSFVPDDPIFNSYIRTTPLVAGARHHDDPLKEVHRVIDLEQVYSDPPFFLATPTLIAPSTEKIVYSERFDEFWRGMGSRGATSFRMVIIGYSLPPSDDYARQVIYRLVRNYQNISGERVDSRRGPKEPLIFVDLCRNTAQKRRVKNRYRFIDWGKSRAYFDGFNGHVIAALVQ